MFVIHQLHAMAAWKPRPFVYVATTSTLRSKTNIYHL